MRKTTLGSRTAALALSGVFVGLLCLVSCAKKDSADAKSSGEKKFSPTHAASEYQMLQAQLKLASTDKPYLVLDFAQKQLRLELEGTLVWNYPLDVSPDDIAEIGDFVERFHSGSQLVRPITQTYLFSGQTKTSDSILNIVSEVTKVKAELLQRELPEHFQLFWGENVSIDIFTDIKGQPTDKFKNTVFEIRHALQTPFGKARITIKMPSGRALTLFRVAQPGLPTFVIPPPPKA